MPTRDALNGRLAEAVKNGDAAEVRRLLAAGADMEARDDIGRTPLILAAWLGDAVTAKALVGAGADVNAKDEHGRTPLILAAWSGSAEIANLLVGAGADLNARTHDGRTALVEAAEHGEAEVANLLVAAGADLNAQEKRHGMTALLAAVWNYGLENYRVIARMLIEAGADLNAATTREVDDNLVGPTPIGTTALIYALICGYGEAARLLVEAGADVNVGNVNGMTPLMQAVWSGWSERAELAGIVPLLIAAGADVNARDHDGWTALALAARRDHTEAAQALIRAGADAAHAEAVLRRDDFTTDAAETLRRLAQGPNAPEP